LRSKQHESKGMARKNKDKERVGLGEHRVPTGSKKGCLLFLGLKRRSEGLAGKGAEMAWTSKKIPKNRVGQILGDGVKGGPQKTGGHTKKWGRQGTKTKGKTTQVGGDPKTFYLLSAARDRAL